MEDLEKLAARLDGRAEDYEKEAVAGAQVTDLDQRVQGIAFQVTANVLREVARAMRSVAVS